MTTIAAVFTFIALGNPRQPKLRVRLERMLTSIDCVQISGSHRDVEIR